MYKAIFSDLDATLLNNQKKISAKDIEAIKRAKESGCKFLFCTGRLPFCFEMFVDEVGLTDYVAGNGELVMANGKLIKEVYLKKEDALKIINYGIENNYYERIFTIDTLYSLNGELGGEDIKSFIPTTFINHEETIALANTQIIYKVTIHDEHEKLLKVKKDFEEMNLDVDLIFSNPRFLELVYKGQSKGNSVIDYCKYMNIDLKDTIGVGDEENDIQMLKNVGLACCPANATAEVKAVCDYETKATNNESAMAEIIEKYVI